MTLDLPALIASKRAVGRTKDLLALPQIEAALRLRDADQERLRDERPWDREEEIPRRRHSKKRLRPGRCWPPGPPWSSSPAALRSTGRARRWRRWLPWCTRACAWCWCTAAAR